MELLKNLGVDGPKLIAQLINFGIVLFVLWRFAYKPVLEMLETRRQKIAKSMDEAEQIKAELAETQAVRDKVMAEANARAEKLIADAKEAAKQVGKAEGERAVKQAEEIIRKAREATEAEYEKMEAKLKAHIGRLAVETAIKVSGKVLTAEDQQRLIDETNKELAA